MTPREDLREFTKTSLDWDDVIGEVAGDTPEFPKYTTQLMNIANQNAQGTRPEVVGQMSELIQQCPNPTYTGWRRWYLENYGDRIDRATDRVWPMVQKMLAAGDRIDRDMVRAWIEDLVITKTAEGLIIQEAILHHLAEREGADWRLAGPEEESKNIDGYLNGSPISIKPHTYLSKKASVRERIDAEVVYYKKTSRYLHIYREPQS